MYVWRLVRATDEWRLIGTSLIRVVSIEITQVCLVLPPSDHKFTFLDVVDMHTIRKSYKIDITHTWKL